jgi:hypothetical protein
MRDNYLNIGVDLRWSSTTVELFGLDGEAGGLHALVWVQLMV